MTVVATASESAPGRPQDGEPAAGAALGAVGVLVFFSIVTDKFLTPLGTTTWLDDASSLGIVAVAVALLMIRGEFDLSAGAMTASTALVTALLAVQAGWNVWLALLPSLLFALAVGALNGWLVIRTGLPSFIITLGTFLALQGLNLGVTRLVTGTVQVAGIRGAQGYSSAGWAFAVGGSLASARAVGVPAARTKILLFMTTAFAGWVVGCCNILRFDSVQANQGIGLEFQYIVAAVVGGCLLTGGFGSVVGAIGKSYGGVVALQDVSMVVHAGEVSCVLGDNGAGKSTLIKILAGVHQHDSGELRIAGEPTRLSSPRAALDQGIATVYQDLALVPLMSVWRNFVLG